MAALQDDVQVISVKRNDGKAVEVTIGWGDKEISFCVGHDGYLYECGRLSLSGQRTYPYFPPAVNRIITKRASGILEARFPPRPAKQKKRIRRRTKSA